MHQMFHLLCGICCVFDQGAHIRRIFCQWCRKTVQRMAWFSADQILPLLKLYFTQIFSENNAIPTCFSNILDDKVLDMSQNIVSVFL